MPFFFFSYARNDAQDAYLRKFFDELTVEVSVRLGIDPSAAGFIDTNMPPGSPWAEATAQALATCKVFIPVYSPSFFQSSYCGREWHCFSQRLADSESSSELILPVWWLPSGANFPACAESIQDPRDGYSDAFRNYGLRFLRQLKRNRSDYQRFLTTFAAQAIEAAERHQLLDGQILDLCQSPDAFRIGIDVASKIPEASGRGRGGPKWVRFIVVVGTRAQMRQYRAHLDYYGDEWDAWRPYHPACDDPIGVHVQLLAGTQRLNSVLNVADSELLHLMRKAEKQREIVVLLIDCWATKIESYSTLLNEYDLEQFDNVAVVVPANISDEETAERLGHLRSELFKRLRRSMRNNIELFREDTSDVDAFERALQQVIIEVRRRIVDENPPERRAGPATEHPSPMPMISGTGV